jgi:hypothetical protein
VGVVVQPVGDVLVVVAGGEAVVGEGGEMGRGGGRGPEDL